MEGECWWLLFRVRVDACVPLRWYIRIMYVPAALLPKYVLYIGTDLDGRNLLCNYATICATDVTHLSHGYQWGAYT